MTTLSHNVPTWIDGRCAESGMRYREIAHELGVTEAAVKHRLHRARRKVRELVDRMDED